jgi:UDP-glucose 4-epimerase
LRQGVGTDSLDFRGGNNTGVKQILITGGAGFIGSHLAEVLLDRGHRVTALDDESAGSPENLQRVVSHFDFHYVRGSASDAGRIRDLVGDADEVYHLAAAVGVKRIADDPVDCIDRLLAPTQVLLAELGRCAASGRPVKMFLASSSEVYGNSSRDRCREDDPLVLGPTSESRWCYGASKAMDEFLALAYWRQHRVPVVIGRLFNVVGPRQTGRYGMVLPRFVENALAGHPPVVYDDGQQVRCFTHVTDACVAMTELMDTDSAVGQVFNVGIDEPVTILQVAERVVAAVNRGLDIEFESYRNVYGDDFRDVRRRVPDLSKLKRTIRHEPQYNLDLIIQDVIHWKSG